MNRRVLKRPALGFIVGPIVGGSLVSAYFTVGYATAYPMEGGTFVPTAANTVNWALMCFAIAAVVWAIGLATVGNAIWFLLHRQGFRGPVAATLSGCMAVYSSSLLFMPSSLADAIEPTRLMLAVSGGVVALAMERVAYGRPKPPPARPS